MANSKKEVAAAGHEIKATIVQKMAVTSILGAATVAQRHSIGVRAL